MFEDSLVESTGRIRTRSSWYAIGSFAFQAALLTTFLLIPLLYPAALPRQALSSLLTAPPPPAPAQTQHTRTFRALNPSQLAGLIVPSLIPHRIIEGGNASSSSPNMNIVIDGAGNGDTQGAIPLLASPPPLPALARGPDLQGRSAFQPGLPPAVSFRPSSLFILR